MSYADLPGYNYFVLKFSNFVRGFLIIISIVLLILLMSASNWLPLNRMISQAQTAIETGNYLSASLSLAQAAHYSAMFEFTQSFAIMTTTIMTNVC